MMSLETVTVSEIRKNMAEYFVEAVHKNKLIGLSRYEKERAYLVGEEMLDTLLNYALLAPDFDVFDEEDGSKTIVYKTLDLLANGDTYEATVEDIVIQAQEYADDYLNDINLYHRDPERKNHLPLLILISKARSKDEIRNLLGLQQG